MEKLSNTIKSGIKMQTNKIDAVYVIGDQCDWGNYNELKFSLRSLQKNFNSLRDVWIIGHKPDWLKNIHHIPFPDPYKKNKDANLINKIIRVCLETELTSQFIFMSDDQLVTKPISPENFRRYYVEYLDENTSWGNTKWINRLKHTYNILKENNFSTYNYDTHLPCLYNKVNFPKIMLQYDYGCDTGYTINTLYYNSLDNHELKVEVNDNIKAGFYQETKENIILEKIENSMFLNFDNNGLNDFLKQIIIELFSEKSKYEK